MRLQKDCNYGNNRTLGVNVLLQIYQVFFIRNLYYDFHAQVGGGRPSSEASVPDTDAADMGGVTGRGEGGRGREGMAEEGEGGRGRGGGGVGEGSE